MANSKLNEYTKKLQLIVDSIIQDPSVYKGTKAKLIIHATSLICALVAVQPIPFADIFVLSPIQLVMVTALNKILGNPFEKSSLKEVLASLLGVVGWGTMAQHIILGLYKSVLPFAGGFTTIPLVYAATYALGCGAKILIEAKKNEQTLSDEALKKAFQDAKKEAEAEQKKLSMPEALAQVSTLLKDAEKYNEYKNQLLSLDKSINKVFSSDVTIEADIEKLFIRRKSLISERLKSKYKNIKLNDYIISILAVLDGKEFVEIAEPIVSQINYNLAEMDCRAVYTGKKGKFLEIKTSLGMILVNQSKKTEIVSVQLEDKYMENALLRYIVQFGKEETLLRDIQIKEQFHKIIKNAKQYIYIVSPWVGSWPYETLISLMKEAVSSNPSLTIKVLYGMKDFGSSFSSKENIRLNESRKYVQMYKNELGTSFASKETNTHVKLVICDDECYMIGSMNVLSFDADYEGKSEDALHHEVAILSQDKEMLLQLKDVYFNW